MAITIISPADDAVVAPGTELTFRVYFEPDLVSGHWAYMRLIPGDIAPVSQADINNAIVGWVRTPTGNQLISQWLAGTYTLPSAAPSVDTYYTIYANRAGGSSDTHRILVPALPVVTINTPAQTIQPLSNLVLDATVTGLGTITNLWTVSPAGITFANSAITDATLTAPRPLVQTRYTLTLTATNESGSSSDSVQITVIGYPLLEATVSSPQAYTRATLLKDDIRATSAHPPALTTAELVAETPVLPQAEDLIVARQSDDTAYLQALLSWTLNVLNPPTPDPSLWALNDSGDEFWQIDVDTLSNSASAGGLPTPMTGPAGLAVHNGALYGVDRPTSSLYNILTITPANSALVGAFPPGFEEPVGLVSHNGIFFGINAADNSLWDLDDTHPPNSFPIGVFPPEMGTPGALASYDGKLLCFASDGLWDVDSLNPAASTRIGAWPAGLTMPSGATVHDDTLYCTDGAGAQLWEPDVVTPADTTLVGAFPSGLAGPSALASHDPDAPFGIEYRNRIDGNSWGDWIPITGATATTEEHVVTFLAAGFASYGKQIDFQVRAIEAAAGPESNTDSITFERTAGIQIAEYEVRLDVDGDGSFSAELDADWHIPLFLQRGFQYEGQRYGQSIAGNIRFSLRNDHNRYTLGEPTGIFSGLDEAPEGAALRIVCKPPDTRARYQLGQGSVEDFVPKFLDSGRHRVDVFCLGIINRLAGRLAVTRAYTGISGEDAMIRLLEAAGISDDNRGVISAPTPINLWWAEGNALGETRVLERLIRAFAYEDEFDRMALQGLSVRALASRQDPVAYFDMRQFNDADRPAEALGTVGIIERPSTNRQITNVAQARAQLYDTRPAQELWRLSQPVELAGFTTTTLQIPAPPGGAFDYFLDAEATVTANSQRDGTGADRTSSVSVDQTLRAPHILLKLENTGAPSLFVTDVVIVGTSLIVDEVIDVEERNASSITEYGERSFPQVPIFRDSIVTARQWAASILSDLISPVDRIAFTTVANHDFHTVLNLKFGDHIHVHDGISLESYYIDQIEQYIHDGLEHHVRFTCSPIIDYSGIILLDIGPALGTGTLAR